MVINISTVDRAMVINISTVDRAIVINISTVDRYSGWGHGDHYQYSG